MSGETLARNSARRRSSSRIVIKAGDEQSDDFEPQSHLVNAANAFQDGTDASAEFMVVAIVEALEIDLVEIKPGAQVFEDLRSAIAVGNESGEQARSSCLFEDGYGPFAGDKWLVVCADYNSRALHKGVAHQSVG